MSTQLRQEILARTEHVLYLARWKVLVVSAMFVSGLGLTTISEAGDVGPAILLGVGFPCLYIDVFVFRSYLTVHSIARYMRNYQGNDKSFIEERSYERFMGSLRLSSRLFSERYAHIAASLAFIGLGLVAALWRLEFQLNWLILIPFAIIAAEVTLFRYYNLERQMLIQQNAESDSESS